MSTKGFRTIASTLVFITLTVGALGAGAEDKLVGTAPTAQVQARPLDRDGKPIYGAEIMTEQELGGYRSLMHFTKTLAERDQLRAEHRKNMEKRAQERGVKLAE